LKKETEQIEATKQKPLLVFIRFGKGLRLAGVNQGWVDHHASVESSGPWILFRPFYNRYPFLISRSGLADREEVSGPTADFDINVGRKKVKGGAGDEMGIGEKSKGPFGVGKKA
jgi:hypothetical protein